MPATACACDVLHITGTLLPISHRAFDISMRSGGCFFFLFAPGEYCVSYPQKMSTAFLAHAEVLAFLIPVSFKPAARLLNYCDGLASTPSRPFVKNHVNKRPAKHGAKCGTPWPCPGRRGGRRSKSGDGGQDLLEHIAQISAALLSSKLLNHL